MGLREIKKAKTKRTISDLATQMFMERGFNEVTIAEIAQKAEVSVATIFNYFPTKESLVFEENGEREDGLKRAVQERGDGHTILEALLEHLLQAEAFKTKRLKQSEAFHKFVESTPELKECHRKMWMRYEVILAETIASDKVAKATPLQAGAIAHFILDAFLRALSQAKPKPALIELFQILKLGWNI